MTPESAALLARYNRWMNQRMFEAAGRLDHAELRADKGAFFGSILGTLNHLAVGDTVWLHRFARHPAGFASLGAMEAFPRPTSLRQTLVADLPGLAAYRQRLDDVILRWVAELTPEHLASDLSYANMAGVPARRNLGGMLQHFFNHQTHHRGQVSTLLFQSGVDVGATDLFSLIPESGA
jgi:uncharacterized damage-inducible protein DinB